MSAVSMKRLASGNSTVVPALMNENTKLRRTRGCTFSRRWRRDWNHSRTMSATISPAVRETVKGFEK